MESSIDLVDGGANHLLKRKKTGSDSISILILWGGFIGCTYNGIMYS